MLQVSRFCQLFRTFVFCSQCPDQHNKSSRFKNGIVKKICWYTYARTQLINSFVRSSRQSRISSLLRCSGDGRGLLLLSTFAFAEYCVVMFDCGCNVSKKLVERWCGEFQELHKYATLCLPHKITTTGNRYLELMCFGKITGISYKDRITNEYVRKTIVGLQHNNYIRRDHENCKATKTEMLWVRDKIRRPNQSDTSRDNRRQAKKGAGRRSGLTASWSGPSSPSQRLKPWHTSGRSGVS